MVSEYDKFSAVEPTGNAGRGSVNPPLVGEPQPQRTYIPTAAPVERPYSGLPPAAQAYQTFIEGGLRGLTAGTSEYGRAGLGYLADRIKNIGTNKPTKSYEEQLAETRARTEMLKEDNPNAYAAGDITGAVGLGILTRGKSLPMTVATQGAAGAVRNYSENPDTTVGDALTAGVLQAGVTGALGVGGKVLNYGADKLEQAFQNRFMQVVNEQSAKLGRALTPDETSTLYNAVAKGLEVLPVLGRGVVAAGKEIKSGIFPAAVGGTAGAVSGLFTGDPLTNAMWGAGGALALSKANAINILSDEAKVAAGRMAIKAAPYIGKVAPYVAPATAGAVSPYVTKSIPRPSNDYSSISTVEKEE